MKNAIMSAVTAVLQRVEDAKYPEMHITSINVNCRITPQGPTAFARARVSATFFATSPLPKRQGDDVYDDTGRPITVGMIKQDPNVRAALAKHGVKVVD